MIDMSNLEEFAQAVGRDVKRFETDYTSKAELEAKDYIEGKTEYQILKHQVESLVKQTQTLQEQLALIKPAPRRAPMAYTLDRSSVPWTLWFDNGCGMQLESDPDNIALYGIDTHARVEIFGSTWKTYPLLSNILSCSHGTLSLEKIKRDIDATFWNDKIKILNPVKNEDAYDWSNAFLSAKGVREDRIRSGEKNVVRVFYALGIWDAKTVESLGAVRR